MSVAQSDPKTQIVGVWKLVSVMYEDQESKTLTPVLGENPKGYQIATPDGRWLALATPLSRAVPKTDQERAQAFVTMIAYSGRYRRVVCRDVPQPAAPACAFGPRQRVRRLGTFWGNGGRVFAGFLWFGLQPVPMAGD